MLKISWVQRISNKKIRNKIEQEVELLKIIKKRKHEYLGHVLRGNRYSMLQLILYAKIKRKRGIRKKYSWLQNIHQWTGLSADELLYPAPDRQIYRQIIMEATNISIWVRYWKKKKTVKMKMIYRVKLINSKKRHLIISTKKNRST